MRRKTGSSEGSTGGAEGCCGEGFFCGAARGRVPGATTDNVSGVVDTLWPLTVTEIGGIANVPTREGRSTNPCRTWLVVCPFKICTLMVCPAVWISRPSMSGRRGGDAEDTPE